MDRYKRRIKLHFIFYIWIVFKTIKRIHLLKQSKNWLCASIGKLCFFFEDFKGTVLTLLTVQFTFLTVRGLKLFFKYCTYSKN